MDVCENMYVLQNSQRNKRYFKLYILSTYEKKRQEYNVN